MLQLRDATVVNIPSMLARYYENVDVTIKPQIKLSTIHSAKGREADRVILDTALTRRITNEMADDPSGEARVFYVGVTRAKHRLDIVHSTNGYQL
jgi:superfamily I DNA/RNA helicase